MLEDLNDLLAKQPSRSRDRWIRAKLAEFAADVEDELKGTGLEYYLIRLTPQGLRLKIGNAADTMIAVSNEELHKNGISAAVRAAVRTWHECVDD